MPKGNRGAMRIRKFGDNQGEFREVKLEHCKCYWCEVASKHVKWPSEEAIIFLENSDGEVRLIHCNGTNVVCYESSPSHAKKILAETKRINVLN